MYSNPGHIVHAHPRPPSDFLTKVPTLVLCQRYYFLEGTGHSALWLHFQIWVDISHKIFPTVLHQICVVRLQYSSGLHVSLRRLHPRFATIGLPGAVVDLDNTFLFWHSAKIPSASDSESIAAEHKHRHGQEVIK